MSTARIRLARPPEIDPAAADRLPGFPARWSPTRTHRYTLWRWWTPNPIRYGMVVGLNPSAATEEHDDRTVRRCTDFVRREGLDAMVMLNAFAFMATDPKQMRAHPDPVGDENDAWLARCAEGASLLIAAWGSHASHIGRSRRLAEILPGAYCLGTTSAGEPKHPLYLAKDTALTPWPAASKRLDGIPSLD
ncbi:DUF1643 domain-containing protein [Marinivivus vitaminiproducens]|uniref:DUF1643 domain-containing protein n=1 Tax=Marinivivus vitaminiproducens TaxID=3035935 RepID=UPI0027A3339F|nr:DUF1643 domain-containing protein [Geminicoccaceae bacterium SCSIO 64248]